MSTTFYLVPGADGGLTISMIFAHHLCCHGNHSPTSYPPPSLLLKMRGNQRKILSEMIPCFSCGPGKIFHSTLHLILCTSFVENFVETFESFMTRSFSCLQTLSSLLVSDPKKHVCGAKDWH